VTSSQRILRVPLKFEVSARILWAPVLRLKASESGLGELGRPVNYPTPPQEGLPRGVDGYLVRSQPVNCPQLRLRFVDGWLCYIPAQYLRYYADLGQNFDRAILLEVLIEIPFHHPSEGTEICRYNRRGSQWRIYATPNELTEFCDLARRVSEKTYQERILGQGCRARVRSDLGC
jgi:hypothetical protein